MAEGMNSLGRLNEILFDELERLNSLDITDKEAVAVEVSRSKAIQDTAKEVNQSARTILETAKLRAGISGAKSASVPKLLEG